MNVNMVEDILLDDLKSVIMEASALMPEQISANLSIETKERNSLVTDIDKGIEAYLVDKLGKLLPKAGFIAEEGTADHRGEEYNWIIDPLDGTTNFIHGIPAFCISVGLQKKGEIVLGAIFEFGRNSYFHAIKGGGSYKDGVSISVSKTEVIDDSLLATGFPYYDFSLIDQYMMAFTDFMKMSRGIRRLGSAALDMVYVACGKFEGFFEYSLHPWDVAAGIILVEEAGGRVTDFRGGNDFLFGREMLASNRLIHEDMLKLIRPHF